MDPLNTPPATPDRLVRLTDSSATHTCSPFASPGYFERIRAQRRSANREQRNMDLHGSPRRRRTLATQDENVPPVQSSASMFITYTPATMANRNLRPRTPRRPLAAHSSQKTIRQPLQQILPQPTQVPMHQPVLSPPGSTVTHPIPLPTPPPTLPREMRQDNGTQVDVAANEVYPGVDGDLLRLLDDYQAANHVGIPLDAGLNNDNRLLPEQRERLRQPHTQPKGLFFAARLPYRDPLNRHDLGYMNVPCPKCNALHWIDERLSRTSKRNAHFGLCCMDGKVRLRPLEEPPEPLCHLLTSQERDATAFREDLWKYNRAFAFTSLGVSEDNTVNENRQGPPVFRIFGELCHRSSALEPDPITGPRYSQLYVYEPRAALEARMHNNANLDRDIMARLQTMLDEYNPYVPIYRHAYQVLQGYDPANDAVVRLRLTADLDRRRYNLPTADEVAMILPGNQTASEPRDIILRLHSGPLHRISDLHPAYAPLQYPLLFPRGESGWYPEMKLQETEEQRVSRIEQQSQRRRQRHNQGIELNEDDNGGPDSSRRLTLTRYTAYRLHFRRGEFNPLHYCGRLFTRFLVDMFASANQQRLSWIVRNQPTFRAARFNNLEDAAANDPDNVDLNDLGQRVILPSSFTGGPRNMAQGFQDSMAIARFFRKVDIFLTATTNPDWAEIRRELLPGQTAYDRPDLVARVFQMKKKAIIEYIYKHGVFGHAVAYVYTIEFQKRGLPHVHCLIFLKDPYKLQTPEAIDSCIWARWPDPETEPLLFETVKKCMVHGPCGPEYPSAPCMVDGKCSKKFPKEFQPFTTMDGNGYPKYFRPNDGCSYEVRGVMVDNRWIVPYSPYLCAIFDCHINVECAISLGSFKYIFKYIQKGPDLASVEIDMKDEVKRFINGCYISAPIAVWRSLQFEIHEQIPNVVRLQIHLPNHHMVTFNPNDDLATIIARGANQRTTLTAFFEANANQGPLGEEARKYTYQEFPQHFVFDTNQRKWKIRKRGFALGRMYFIKPTAGELFYLRLLLTVVKGAKSFEDLCRVPGSEHPLPTYYAACLARSLLEDDGEWRLCLEEACQMQTGTRLRQLFATLLLFAEPAQPHELWNEFRSQICDDVEWRLQSMGIQNCTNEDIFDYGLFLLDKVLGDSGHSLGDFPSMPRPQKDWAAFTMNPLIAEQLNYNRDQEQHDLDEKLPKLNQDQLYAYTQIVNAVEQRESKIFFLNGPGGTGKTYVYNTVCAKLRSEGKIVLCVSSSGISALLIRGGRTAHSTFKIPIDSLTEDSFCNIPKTSMRAELFRATQAIIWDEIGAQHRHALEAVDRTLRDIRSDDRPFGGIPVVLGGDFLQTLPVVPKGSREDIINATIQHSHLWEGIQVLHLRQNMRLQQGTANVVQFSRWLLDVGHGRNMEPTRSQVELPNEMCVENGNALINSIYSTIGTHPPPPPEYFSNRMILAPRNADVGLLNEQILNRMSGDMRQYISADSMVHEAGADPDETHMVPVEFLRSITASGLPPGELNLKVGCPVILLRNLSPSAGLCNGTRMVVTRMSNRVIEARLLGGEHDGEIAMIPRITLTPSARSADVTFKFKRRQFPLRLAFALSINKAQGQSVKYVGLDLRIPVFAHGQLYVALSRVTSSQNIKILLPNDTHHHCTPNVVYEEVLLD